jgi:hypothetical protein
MATATGELEMIYFQNLEIESEFLPELDLEYL